MRCRIVPRSRWSFNCSKPSLALVVWNWSAKAHVRKARIEPSITVPTFTENILIRGLSMLNIQRGLQCFNQLSLKKIPLQVVLNHTSMNLKRSE